jgi:hypothetical protein
MTFEQKRKALLLARDLNAGVEHLGPYKPIRPGQG